MSSIPDDSISKRDFEKLAELEARLEKLVAPEPFKILDGGEEERFAQELTLAAQNWMRGALLLADDIKARVSASKITIQFTCAIPMLPGILSRPFVLSDRGIVSDQEIVSIPRTRKISALSPEDDLEAPNPPGGPPPGAG